MEFLSSRILVRPADSIGRAGSTRRCSAWPADLAATAAKLTADGVTVLSAPWGWTRCGSAPGRIVHRAGGGPPAIRCGRMCEHDPD